MFTIDTVLTGHSTPLLAKLMVGQDDWAYVQDDTSLGDDHAVEDLGQLVIISLPGCVTNRLDEFGDEQLQDSVPLDSGAIPGLGLGCLTLR